MLHLLLLVPRFKARPGGDRRPRDARFVCLGRPRRPCIRLHGGCLGWLCVCWQHGRCARGVPVLYRPLYLQAPPRVPSLLSHWYISNKIIKTHGDPKKFEFKMDKCQSCGLIFCNPYPSKKQIYHYYNSEMKKFENDFFKKSFENRLNR